MSFSFPKVYPILDAGTIPQAGRAEFLRRLGAELAEAGVTLLEYRNKSGSDEELLADAAILRAALPARTSKLILDDRVDLVERAGFDGVHVDAGDVTPAEARRMLGPERIVGTFGGSETLVPGILKAPADYLSIGPIFPTTTKQTTKAADRCCGGPQAARASGAECGACCGGRSDAGDGSGNFSGGSECDRRVSGDIPCEGSCGRVSTLARCARVDALGELCRIVCALSYDCLTSFGERDRSSCAPLKVPFCLRVLNIAREEVAH